MMLKRLSGIFISFLIATTAHAQGTIPKAAEADSVAPESRKGLVNRVIDYFSSSNKTRTDKKFDFSILGGPHYSSDSKFGIGIVAAGVYNTDPADSAWLRPSNVSIYGDATTAAHFKLGVRGVNIWPGDTRRLTYDLAFHSIQTNYWGIGYDQCSDDENESKYRYLSAEVKASLTWRLADHFYVGPLLAFDYVNGRHFEPPTLWRGLPDNTVSWGPGISFSYDSRDCITAPARGVNVKLDQWFALRPLGCTATFSVNEFQASWYGPMWRDAVLATLMHWRLTWGRTPWTELSQIGGSDNMRGYFEGRYRDKNEVDLCVELRQHVWRRNSLALWVGAASLFPGFDDIDMRQVLPNYGIGYRWEFKKRMNVRIDLGFGRHQTGFIFNINEAF